MDSTTERASSNAGAASPPNVLLIVTDQHRPDHTGFGGNPVVQTPNLDALAARGTRFERAYVSNPICMPNRSTILTGRMPSVHGVRFNGVSLDWGANTFVRTMREHGYRTGLVGKAHLQNMGHGPEVAAALIGGPSQDAFRTSWPEGWNEWEDKRRHQEGHVQLPDDWYGFDHVDLVVDHADSCSGHYYQWLIGQGFDPAVLLGPENKQESLDLGWEQIYRPGLPEELYPTTYVGQRSVEFLEEAASIAAPFFLQMSFPDPHHPFTPPGRFYDMYDPADIPLPPTFDDAHERSMPHLRNLVEARGNFPLIPVAPFAATEELYRQAAAKEYGMISMIDDVVGDVLGAIDRLGLAENTIVVFTSDHGEMFGDHGLMLKGGMHYEGCVRVPLVIAGASASSELVPDVGQVSNSLVSSIDLPETILSLCGLPPFFGMQGLDLSPVLSDPTATVRTCVLVEEDELFDLVGSGRPLRMRTVLTNDARMTRYEGSEHGELFDLGSDPHELANLHADPAGDSLRSMMTDALLAEMIRLADDSPKPTHFA
jgi:arylsulfatase A-like enzyme